MNSETSSEVLIWWVFLSSVSVLNIAIWFWCLRCSGKESDSILRTRRSTLLWLSAGYVFGCAFRSFLPRADVQRIVLVDHWLSSVFIGRSVATIAELCFVAQWAVMLRAIGEDGGGKIPLLVSRVILPLIVVAETCSWYAVVTTNYLGNTCEESLWAITATLATFALLSAIGKFQGRERIILGLAVIAGLAYVGFMCTVDVPMYFGRWQADSISGRSYFTLAEGVKDVATRWTLTRSFSDWKTEIPWMSLYFSFAVWMSIAFARAPRFRPTR